MLQFLFSGTNRSQTWSSMIMLLCTMHAHWRHAFQGGCGRTVVSCTEPWVLTSVSDCPCGWINTNPQSYIPNPSKILNGFLNYCTSHMCVMGRYPQSVLFALFSLYFSHLLKSPGHMTTLIGLKNHAVVFTMYDTSRQKRQIYSTYIIWTQT